MKLPELYLEQMRQLLGTEYEAYLEAMAERPFCGLRINRAKLRPGEWEKIRPFGGDRVPWTDNGYYYDASLRPALDPCYAAGLYYLQEPSAMAPAALLNVQPGDRVLDLCAAPGGKSTEIGASLAGTGGLLVANDISNTRARALLKNLERFGLADMAVTSESPERLLAAFGCFFDRVLVDAPCSGEGMFRKDPELIKSWEERGPEAYVPLQRELLLAAAQMLKPGGTLLYSTCTFDPREDEENVAWLLSQAPEFAVVPLPQTEGTAAGVNGEPFLRFFPHRLKGEGHFAACLRKLPQKNVEESPPVSKQAQRSDYEEAQIAGLRGNAEFHAWVQELSVPPDGKRLRVREERIYLWPSALPEGLGLRFLRTGLLLGEFKKRHFVPSQAAAMALPREGYQNMLSLGRSDARVLRYLKGETIFPECGERLRKGWVLICVDGWPLGWAKYTGSLLKNKYHTGWRWQA